MLDLKAIRERCFPEDGPKTPPTPQEVEELIGAVEQAREIIDGLLNENHTCTQDDYSNCKYCASNSRGEAWLARFK